MNEKFFKLLSTHLVHILVIIYSLQVGYAQDCTFFGQIGKEYYGVSFLKCYHQIIYGDTFHIQIFYQNLRLAEEN